MAWYDSITGLAGETLKAYTATQQADAATAQAKAVEAAAKANSGTGGISTKTMAVGGFIAAVFAFGIWLIVRK